MRYSKSSNTESDEVFKIQQERESDEVFKIQQEKDDEDEEEFIFRE